ncbi:VCBS repeat-containing protein, partial [bacterium]|nr:VCBS repeat-containing protein [bacterium]
MDGDRLRLAARTGFIGKAHRWLNIAGLGDFNGDGWVDVLLTAVGGNRLFRNQGGKFTDVTPEAGVAGPRGKWSTAATWADVDNDGD